MEKPSHILQCTCWRTSVCCVSVAFDSPSAVWWKCARCNYNIISTSASFARRTINKHDKWLLLRCTLARSFVRSFGGFVRGTANSRPTYTAKWKPNKFLSKFELDTRSERRTYQKFQKVKVQIVVAAANELMASNKRSRIPFPNGLDRIPPISRRTNNVIH